MMHRGKGKRGKMDKEMRVKEIGKDIEDEHGRQIKREDERGEINRR